MEERIKVLLVDDHPMMRIGTKMFITGPAHRCDVIGEAADVKEAKNLVDEKHQETDIILLDIILPDGNGADVAAYIKEKYPNIKILVLSVDVSNDTIRRLLDIGIDGFVCKNASSTELNNAIESIMSGFSYYGSDVASIINMLSDAVGNNQVSFTQRELEVMQLCSEGLSAKMVADKLSISSRTVENIKAKIFQKLGFNSTSQVIIYAIEHGLVKI